MAVYVHVLGDKRIEMVAVQLARSYCLPSLLYGCEIWHTRSADVKAVSVAWNNIVFRKIFRTLSQRSLYFRQALYRRLQLEYLTQEYENAESATTPGI